MKLVYGGPNWVELPENKEHEHNDVRVSYQSMLQWSDADLLKMGVKKLKMQTVPQGKYVRDYTITNNAGEPVQVCTFEDIPAPKYYTKKSDIWNRLTTAEYDKLDVAISTAPAKVRRVYEAHDTFDHDSQLYIQLRSAIEKATSVARADIIMAPSNV